MDQQDILNLLKGKEESVVLINSYRKPSNDVQGIYIGTETVDSDGESLDAIVLMYRDWRKLMMVDTVLLQDTSLEISDRKGQLHVRYTSSDSSIQLTKRHDDYDALQKLVEDHGL